MKYDEVGIAVADWKPNGIKYNDKEVSHFAQHGENVDNCQDEYVDAVRNSFGSLLTLPFSLARLSSMECRDDCGS